MIQGTNNGELSPEGILDLSRKMRRINLKLIKDPRVLETKKVERKFWDLMYRIAVIDPNRAYNLAARYSNGGLSEDNFSRARREARIYPAIFLSTPGLRIKKGPEIQRLTSLLNGRNEASRDPSCVSATNGYSGSNGGNYRPLLGRVVSNKSGGYLVRRVGRDPVGGAQW
jgi:hypothetical protein